MRRFFKKHPVWGLVLLIVLAAILWAIFAPWPKGFVEIFGKKKVFLSALFNGITLGGLYFLVASGFTLIFGLMKIVNLAHGSLYLFGGYIGYEVAEATGWWLLSFVAAFLVVGALIDHGLQERRDGCLFEVPDRPSSDLRCLRGGWFANVARVEQDAHRHVHSRRCR